MPLTTNQIIQIRCPDLYVDANLNTWILLAQEQTDRCYYGRHYNLAVALLSCHMYTLSQRGSGQSGIVTSEREGDLARSYGGFTAKSYLDQTSFGLELQQLKGSSRAAISVLGTGPTIICEGDC